MIKLLILKALLIVTCIDGAVIQLPSLPITNQLSIVQSVPSYRELYFEQTLDHYNFNDDRTFQQRFLLNDEWFNPKEGAIFFYTGSQGIRKFKKSFSTPFYEFFSLKENIIESWNNDLFLFENAARFKALVVFAEHVSFFFKHNNDWFI